MIDSYLIDHLQLREPFASQRSELTVRWPGDMVRHIHEPNSNGMVVATDGKFATVLWSKVPNKNTITMEQMAANMARDIEVEEDNEIMRILMAAERGDRA